MYLDKSTIFGGIKQLKKHNKLLNKDFFVFLTRSPMKWIQKIQVWIGGRFPHWQSTGKWYVVWITLIFSLAGWFYVSLPQPLFADPYSLMITDREGQLLGARIAADGQWRFPPSSTSLPLYYTQALLFYEDKRFFAHPGVDPFSLARAIFENMKAGRVVRGGSTISMQVIRLSRKGKARTIIEKLREIILAVRLELRYNKEEILQLYAAHAPFGGNVVGLETACWRYFGKTPNQLSRAEAAMLAVLPNSPALIHPGRNRELLNKKRNYLLTNMRDAGMMDSLTCSLSLLEKLPQAPHPLPDLAPHLTDRLNVQASKGSGRRAQLTLSAALQTKVSRALVRHSETLQQNYIHNGAALVIDMLSNEVLAYVGNVAGAGMAHGEHVDIIRSPRSTGSIMKPFLYGLSLQEGVILPKSLLTDLPLMLGGFKPQNYHPQYDGVVAADEALIRSLNVPFVYLLRDYGVARFQSALSKAGIQTLTRSPEHYGLSLILGGAEATLFDLASVYASMGRCLYHYVHHNSRYFPSDFRRASIEKEKVQLGEGEEEPTIFSAGAIWQTFSAMRYLKRPGLQGEWESFASSFPVAWKTGTSYGFRDAWAIGVTGRYVVAVWVGNADGEGRPGLVGFKAAAPLLFSIFGLLPDSGPWFDMPFDDMEQLVICRESGERASVICPQDTMWVPLSPVRRAICSYHKEIFTDSSGLWRINRNCATAAALNKSCRFVLSPARAYYYSQRHPEYQALPPWRSDCIPEGGVSFEMQLIYPQDGSRIKLSPGNGQEEGKVVLKAAHRRPEATIFWHVDHQFCGETKGRHELAISPSAGKHLLTLVDDKGGMIGHYFDIQKGNRTKEEEADR